MQCHVDGRCVSAVVFWKIRGAIIKHHFQRKSKVGIIVVIIMKTCHCNFPVEFICRADKISFTSALRRSLAVQERH